MGDSNDTPPNKKIFEASCSAASKFPLYIQPEESAALIEACRHDRERYPRCEDRDLGLFVDEVDGLDLHTVKNLRGADLRLPAFIPIADDGAFNKEIPLGGSLVIVQPQDIVRKRAPYIDTDALKSPLLKGKQVLLSGSGTDRLIEDIWLRRNELDFFSKVGSMGFVGAMAINFSVYEQMCPFGQHLNIKKSLKSAALFEAGGTPCIPHFYAVTRNQRQRILQWLNANPQHKIITINCQMQKERYHLEALKQTIRFFLENCTHELHIILEGYRISWLDGLYDLLPYLHIAQKQPFMDGANYTSTTFDARRERLVQRQVNILPEERGQLVSQSIKARRAYLSHLHRKHRKIFKIRSPQKVMIMPRDHSQSERREV